MAGEDEKSKCVRCCEKTSEVECADCGGNNEKMGSVIPLCLECSDLLHVGFMKGHCIETNDVKEKRAIFREKMKDYLKKEQVLKRNLVEVKFACQNISSRSENNRHTIQAALLAISQALRKREAELSACVAEGATSVRARLVAMERELETRLKSLQGCHERAEKLLTADAAKFVAEHSGIADEIDKLLGEEIQNDVPSLSAAISAAALDTTKVLDILHSFGSEWTAGQKNGEKTQFTDILKEFKEGSTVKGFFEGRMDDRGCFWLCPDMADEVISCLDDLSFEIRKDILTCGWEDLTVKEGSLCVAQYRHDNRWSRARVEKIKGNTAEIRWLDNGGASNVSLSHIQPLRERFTDIPFQGIQCTMFEDMSEEMPRQARWVFSDLAAHQLLECTLIKTLDVVAKVPLFLVEIRHTGEEKQDIAECVRNKAEEWRSSKGPIAYRDIRLLHDNAEDIKVVKEVVNASKSTSDEAAESTTQQEDKEEPQADGEEDKDGQNEHVQAEGRELDGKKGPSSQEDEVVLSEQQKDDGEEEKKMEESVNGVKEQDEEAEGESPKAAENGDAAADGEEEEEDGSRDAGEGPEEVKQAPQETEKQEEPAPAPTPTESVSEGKHVSPTAFIAAHGTYTAINTGSGSSSSSGSDVPLPYCSQLEAGWYQHYGSHYSDPGLGTPGGALTYSLAPGVPVTGEAHGMAPGCCVGVHIASTLTPDGTFWATRARGHEENLHFKKLLHEISIPSDPLPVDQLHRGKMVCAASPETGRWCRARVEEVSGDVVHVRLCDHGTLVSVDCKQVKALDVRHTVFPPQAFECSLAKENLTSFSEGSCRLFQRLTKDEVATAKVVAASDALVYVCLFLAPENSSEVVDVVAELAGNEKRAREDKRPGNVPPSQSAVSNGQVRPVSRGFSQFLTETCRCSTQFVVDVEREFAGLIANVNDCNMFSQSYTFPPMSPDQRAFVHELAEFYGLSSDSRGQDPARQVTVTAHRGRSSVPSPTLSEACPGEPRTVPGLMDEQASDRDYRYMGGNPREDMRGCFTCGEVGHRKSNCPRNARNRDRGKPSGGGGWWGGDGGRKGRKGGGGGRRN